MARPLRIDYPGAFHHVMNRGADHQATFTTTRDREDFTALWAEAVVRYRIVVLAYAWMNNHYHALVVTPDAQLSESLRYIGHVYTQRFNRRNGRDGALFRGRFHSVLIDSDTYLDRVARYIERNPLQAGLVDADGLSRYRWSSLRHYLHPSTTDWVTTEPLISRLGSRHAYLKHVLSDRPDREIVDFYARHERHNVVLGRQDFVNSLPADVRRSRPLAGIPEVSFDEIENAISSLGSNVTFDPVARIVATQLGQSLARASRQELADRYRFPSPQSVSVAIQRKTQQPEAIALRAAVLAHLGRTSMGIPQVS